MSPKYETMSLREEATASWISYLIGGLKEFTTAVASPTRPRKAASLTASKKLQLVQGIKCVYPI